MDDLVSIIVPIYKVEKFISKCVNSIVKQTYKNIEILLIDDGSPDKCPEICDSIAEKDSRIKVIHNKNHGLSFTRNYGLEKANGKYICFVDGDDYIENDFVEVLLNLIKKYKTKLACVSFKEVDENEIYQNNNNSYQQSIDFKMSQEQAIKTLFEKNKIKDYVWNKMYEKSLFENIKFPIDRAMEDLGIMYKIFTKTDFIAFSNQEKYFYVQRKGSILHSLNDQLYNDKFYLANERFYYIKKLYPQLEENFQFAFQTCMECYPYLDKNNSRECETTIVVILQEYKKLIKSANWKLKVKYIIYKINKKMFKKIFKKI